MPSPVPMYLMGRPETANTLSAAPPRLSPSILVRMAPAHTRPGPGQARTCKVWTAAQHACGMALGKLPVDSCLAWSVPLCLMLVCVSSVENSEPRPPAGHLQQYLVLWHLSHKHLKAEQCFQHSSVSHSRIVHGVGQLLLHWAWLQKP